MTDSLSCENIVRFLTRMTDARMGHRSPAGANGRDRLARAIIGFPAIVY
jgi:hypothetical protein